MEHGAISVKQFCDWAGIGLTKAYEEINAGRLTMRKLGRKSMIRMTDAEAWLAALPAGTGPAPHKTVKQSEAKAVEPADAT
ncbi:helix-turn-helix domain-containing protein [Rhizobium gallicum]|uniref:helix-turn-helix domain-containing protein n=1 Tax=Rhizobium gallicum TaxID=56730 RepID=UPI001EF79DBD|nr:helix-turn-helix domain-containing protein [Rhizobium gallicum]ULJ70642.1 helix-turn-helix domain-containing protein [Rhizobium gallicum]